MRTCGGHKPPRHECSDRASPALRAIASLDPVADHQQIVRLSTRCDFPFDTTRSLELALFRTFAVPGISALLDRTGEFARGPQKRYDDTDIIISELIEHGYDTNRGRSALRRMNGLHARFSIPNDQFLYVLSTFIYEPIRWNARFGWRRMTEKERLAMFHFWREVGRRMGIRQIPAGYGEFDRFNQEYERREFAPAASNRRVGEMTLRMFGSWFPSPLRPLVRAGMLCVMDAPLLEAMGFGKPSEAYRLMVLGSLHLRGLLLRLVPRRRAPLLRTAMKHRTYPSGYRIEQLGPWEPLPRTA